MAHHTSIPLPKVAVIHDWLPLIGGGERVLEQIMAVYPQAHVYTLFNFLTDDKLKSLGIHTIYSSYLNKLPYVKRYYRQLLALCPQAIENFDLSDYDIVISSSHAVAKGVITAADQPHISYVHSPTRYAWDMMHQYLKQAKLTKGIKSYIVKRMLHHFRIWDYRTANGVDCYVANSHYIARRIAKVYRRSSTVIYPPVDIDRFTLTSEKDDFYLAASRMVPYKRLDLIAEAFATMPDKSLVIIGDGPEMERVKEKAGGASNITIMGYQSNEVLTDHMQRAKAFIFAAEEDFGIVPVEAQACGTPVIAFGAGGALETVIGHEYDPEHATGTFFGEQQAGSIREALAYFESITIKPERCRAHAEQFSIRSFREQLQHIVEETSLAIKEGNILTVD